MMTAQIQKHSEQPIRLYSTHFLVIPTDPNRCYNQIYFLHLYSFIFIFSWHKSTERRGKGQNLSYLSPSFLSVDLCPLKSLCTSKKTHIQICQICPLPQPTCPILSFFLLSFTPSPSLHMSLQVPRNSPTSWEHSICSHFTTVNLLYKWQCIIT